MVLKNNVDFTQKLHQITAHRASRDEIAALVLLDLKLLKATFEFATDFSNKNHFKGYWVLELVLMQNIELIIPYLDIFCNNLKNISVDKALRPAAKICMTLAYNLKINKKHQNIIIESCFDWLISDVKVATKAYSILALFEFGKQHPWIYPELQAIIEQNFATESNAYKAVAKEVMTKISKSLK
ncbi:hypothetical protein FLBR109950_02360 [Flavobacterium branchiophilum]|uniref:Adenylosuccinate lyase n=1 Tax=Flavobacterium branchiophilum (strain FL-15) TaxID=1034807 RepID=G2Z7G5_FLABF|nr:hypothetical protein [Flavobacterium branchiophilum]CCB69070.1 Protein of unknown function [Flavobacterium branchiophilum FL-15]